MMAIMAKKKVMMKMQKTMAIKIKKIKNMGNMVAKLTTMHKKI